MEGAASMHYKGKRCHLRDYRCLGVEPITRLLVTKTGGIVMPKGN